MMSNINCFTIARAIASVLLLVSLSGCPYSSAYTIDHEPQLEVNETLLGKWAGYNIDQRGEKRPVKMILSKRGDKEYGVLFTGYLDELTHCGIATNDTVQTVGNMASVDGREFMQIHFRAETYIAEVKLTDGKLSFLPLCEHFTNRIVKSSDDLKRSVFFHFKTRLYPLYDEPFCIYNMVKVN
jgi:hypothetical protein